MGIRPAARKVPFSGSKVTKARLYPALRTILDNQRNTSSPQFNPSPPEAAVSDFKTLTEEFDSALSAYVFNRMPIRLLALPGMELIERDEIVQHIKAKMVGIDGLALAAMLEEVDKLSRIRLTEKERRTDDPQEEDVREDPTRSIFSFLFSEYGCYAILSHTWLSDELRYQHTLMDKWQSMYGERSGYKKIRGFCDVAAQHGVSLAWVDTICINKDSSAELDESIRSMYQWYHDASICITYLHQTSIHEPISGNNFSPGTVSEGPLAAMARDRWFTRGWTLQELLAPRRMKFYDANWQAIRPDDNDKQDTVIQRLITEVTGIEVPDITSFDPLKTNSSIIERMVWATRRKTTRGEDRAYSLMGVFGVRLSIAYGEGAESAFFRLVEKIITSRDTSQIMQILAWGGKPISDELHPSRLLPSSPECYLHRPYTSGPDSQLRVAGDFSPKGIATTCKFFPKTREAITLTHLGLRVRLLLIRTPVVDLESLGTGRAGVGKTNSLDIGPFEVTLWCQLYTSDKDDPSQLSSKIRTNIDIDKKYPYRPGKKDFSVVCETSGPHEFFVGIYTFTEDNEYINIPPWYCAFFLGVPCKEEKFSMKNLSSDDFQPNSKIDTRTILQLDNFKQMEVVRVKKSENQELMKVLTVSL